MRATSCRSGFGLGLCLAALAGCGAAPGTGNEGASDEPVGSVSLELMQGPADAKCLRLTVDNPMTAQKVIRPLALTPGAASKFTVAGLPLGAIGILGEAFNVTCANIVATTPFTWTSDRVPVTLSPDVTPTLSLVLHKAAKANIGVDFAVGTQFEDVAAPGPTSSVAAAPDGSVVYTLPGLRAIGRASNGSNATQVAVLNSAPRLIATASNGTIVVTTDARELVVLTPAGVIKATLTLPFDVSDLAIDSAQTAWVGSLNASQLFRVATVGTANPPAGTVVQLPGVPAIGLGVAADGLRVVTPSAPRLLSVSPAGVVTSERSIPQPLTDVTVAADQSVWGYSALSRTMFQFPADGSGPLPFPAPLFGGSGSGIGLMSNTKGVFLSVGGPQVMQFNGPLTSILLVPNSSQITALATSTDGRIWAADSGLSHLVAVTLP